MTIEKKNFRSGVFKDFIAQGAQVGNVLYLSGHSSGGDPILSCAHHSAEGLDKLLSQENPYWSPG
jgi:hypothetical protein